MRINNSKMLELKFTREEIETLVAQGDAIWINRGKDDQVQIDNSPYDKGPDGNYYSTLQQIRIKNKERNEVQ